MLSDAYSQYQRHLDQDNSKLTDYSTFPPVLKQDELYAAYEKTYQALLPENFAIKATCCCCSTLLPSLIDPHIRLSDPIPESEVLPYLSKLRWRSSNAAYDNFSKPLIPPYISNQLRQLALDFTGVLPPSRNSSECKLHFCSRCLKDLKSNRDIPKFSLANNLFSFDYHLAGLPSLTFVEEKIIAKVRLNITIVKLRQYDKTSQVGLKGHVIGVPQAPEKILAQTSLPVPAPSLPNFIHILFVNQRQSHLHQRTLEPYREYFSVSRDKIARWLNFLKRYYC